MDVVVPEGGQRRIVHEIIYDELCAGRIEEPSKQKYLRVIDDFIQGAEGIILGCTEIGSPISQEDCPVPVFDTTQIHAEAAVDCALA
jgi:amino-acid racemase